MDPGNFITNTTLVNALTSIPYMYLEPAPLKSKALVRRVEALWRGKGALAVCDPSKFGIWLFGNGNGDDPRARISSSCVMDKDGGVEACGMKFRVETRGTFETSALRSPDSFQLQGPSKTLSAVNPGSLEAVRNAQMMNARAAQFNNANSMKQGQIPAPVSTAAPNAEALESIAKIRQLFISAVLGSASYLLCRGNGLIPLNARTLTSRFRDGSASLSCARPRLTAPMITIDVALTAFGSLTLRASCQASSALTFVTVSSGNGPVKANIHPGQLLWLAPGGLVAKYMGPCTEDSSVRVPLNIGQIDPHAQTQHWKQHCRAWLSNVGIDVTLLEKSAWLMVQLSPLTWENYFESKSDASTGASEPPTLSEPPKFPWPADLCFTRDQVTGRSGDITQTTLAHGKSTMNRDPLTFAEEWCATKAERDSNVLKRQQSHDAESAARALAETQFKTGTSSAYSPVTTRRNSTGGGVYPTPPDGVQTIAGATPNFDGTSSTSGNANQPTPMNTDSSLPVRDESSSDFWISARPGKETQGSEFPTNDGRNLFDGHITNDFFGENDITDADFNFFDEPDKMLEDSMDATDQNASEEVQELPTVDRQLQGDIGPAITLQPAVEISGFKMIGSDISMSSPPSEIQPSGYLSGLKKGDPRAEERHLLHPLHKVTDEKRDVAPILSPELVFRRLFPDRPPGAAGLSPKAVEHSSELGQYRRIGHFGSIGFEHIISDVNGKYSSHGRFAYNEEVGVAQRPCSTAIPETEYLNSHKRRKGEFFKRILIPLQSAIGLQSDTSGDINETDTLKEYDDPDYGSGSDFSDPDEVSPMWEEASIGLTTGGKRKRESHDEGDDGMASSFQDLAIDRPPLTDADEPIPSILESDAADWPLNEIFDLPEPPLVAALKLSDSDYIAAAQILTDQVASSTLPISNVIKDESSSLSVDMIDEKTVVNMTQKNLAAVARRCFHNVETCNLNKFLGIQGFPSINPITRMPARPHGRECPMQIHFENPFAIKTPHLEVRRSDSKLTVLPSAISFWDNLGLGPCRGIKDISTVCIFPAGEGMQENAAIFLERMRCAYEYAKLGSHDKISTGDLGLDPSLDRGLVSISLPPTSKNQAIDQTLVLDAIMLRCCKVGKALASIPGAGRNLVIYFIYPSDHEEILPLVCAGFYALYETYRKTVPETRAKIWNDLVLQLIPRQFVTSSTAVVVPSPIDYARLATEVYDRCPDSESPSCSPSIMLEQQLPRNIEFKVTINPSVSLLAENSCIHVAYAQSIDDRWISAAWTDNRGAEQMTASYCLGRKNRPIQRTFAEVAKEIWETTLDIISVKAVNWRILLAKSGVMERSEIDVWISLTSKETRASVTLALLSINSRPSLQLLPPPAVLSPTILSTPSGMFTTPVSTPQALGILSPDYTATSTPTQNSMTNAPTSDANPLEPPPSDATLIDITDQTWGSILSHRLNNSNSLLENHPALLSGYLIKRSGTRPEDTPILIEISIVGVSSEGHRNARACDHLLREVMGMYRALGTLARVRGVVASVRDARPWHIAAVEKAVRVLYILM